MEECPHGRPFATARSLGLSATLGLFVFAVLACGGEAPEPEIPWRQVDLCKKPPAQEWKTAWRLRCQVGLETLRGRSFRSVRMRPGGRIVWNLDLGLEPRFSFRPAPEGESCPFIVAVRDENDARSLLLREDFEPTGHNVREQVHVDLSAFQESSIRLVLRLPKNTSSCEAANWVSPVVTERRQRQDPQVAKEKSPRPNVLFLGVDTLRADALGPWRQGSSVTPAIDRLAEQSDVWMNAYTAINNTNPSFISLMTGLYPKNHQIYNLTTPLPQAATTMAELLREAGYSTRGIVSARHLGKSSGLEQGFDEFVVPRRQYFAEAVVNQGIEWMHDVSEPFFIWLHLFDAHVPHNPPRPYDLGYRAAGLAGLSPVDSWVEFREPGPREFDPRTTLEGHVDLYPGEVAYVDRQVDRLLDFMTSRGLLEETIIVLVADHGETLGEREQLFNHSGLFDDTSHVPLMIRWPGARKGRRFSGLVQSLDVFPTLLRAAGVEPPDQDGEDLRGLFEEGDRGRRVVFAENAGAGGWMVRTPDRKLMILEKEPRGRFFFDLEKDPQEANNLAGKGLAGEAELEDLLNRWRQLRRELVQPVELEVSEEERKELEALGYVD